MQIAKPGERDAGNEKARGKPMRRLQRYWWPLLLALLLACNGSKTKVTYLTSDDHLSKADQNILTWLKSDRHFDVQQVALQAVTEPPAGVLWIHIADSQALARWKKADFAKIKHWYDQGAHILCTDFAALIPYRSGIEKRKPEVRTISVKDDWNFDERGFQSWLGHPVFSGMFRGAFVWDLDVNSRLPRIGYFGKRYPLQGRVVAVERSFVFMHPQNRLVIEYRTPQSLMLTVGGMVDFSPHNRLKYKLEKFIENSLLYLAGKQKGKTTYWHSSDCKPKAFIVENTFPLIQPKDTLQNLSHTNLLFKRKATTNFFDLAGRRTLVMGKENGGFDEVWVHPLRIARDFRVGILQGNGVVWLNSLSPEIEIRPESITRIYRTPVGEIKEILFASLEKPGMVLHWQNLSERPLKLILKFRDDLRFMWPYDEKALGSLFYGYDTQSGTLTVQDTTGQFVCLFGASQKPLQRVSGAFKDVVWQGNVLHGLPDTLNQVYHAAVYELNAGNRFALNFVITGTNQGREEALQALRQLMQHPRSEYEAMVRHYRRILNDYVNIQGPDSVFNALWQWALVGVDRFFTRTPQLGEALVAGFATSDRGWDGGSKNSGRPGYAWYFGRDGCWSAFAVDDYGDFGIVKKQLQFYQKFQDLSGKIFHELSTSGVVHYDAADATPLYVILAAHYLRASGDVDFIRQSWSHIKKAMDFLYSTDTDGDGLIENKNVGHGWVEGGKLWGSSPTFYLAALWAQTLKDAAYMAKVLRKNVLHDQYARDAIKVRKILNSDFWNAKDRFYYYGKLGPHRYNAQKTVLPAVAMYYRLLDADKTGTMLDAYADDDFSTDWGVRILSAKSPLFNPKGYHEGSVWPLYTGWTSLAEYAYGRPVQGFVHLRNNMAIKKHWALGFVEEVMNGAVYKPGGVCPHQCWSETNVVDPAIHGMLGWRPMALENKAIVKPQFPLDWDRVRVRNLRVGSSRVAFSMQQDSTRTQFHFRLQEGKPMQIEFYPPVADGMQITAVIVDGQSVQADTSSLFGAFRQPIVFNLKDSTKVILQHHGGIGMLPFLPDPAPGDRSQGYRIIKTQFSHGRLIATLKGKAGSVGHFRVKVFDRPIRSVQGASIEGIDAKGIVKLSVPFGKSKHDFVSKKIIVNL